MNQWRVRPLESLYCFVYLDCIYYKVRDEGRVVSRAVYNVLGINQEGKKELIGMYVAESEGAKFWLAVLTDLKNRGVEDILIACVDGLKGFPEAIEAVFPHTEIQTCVIHPGGEPQIRHTLRYIAEKDKKAFLYDLKQIYQAVNQEEGYYNLLALEENRTADAVG
jgi:putative transposase